MGNWKWQTVVGTGLDLIATPPGRLTLYHRPSSKEIDELAEEGCTMVVTLQDEKEEIDIVKERVTQHSTMKWLWFPSSFRRTSMWELPRNIVVDTIGKVQDELYAGGKVFVHCAEGKDRSGLFAAAVLAACLFDEEEVKDTIVAIRPEAIRGIQDPGAFNWALWIGKQVL